MKAVCIFLIFQSLFAGAGETKDSGAAAFSGEQESEGGKVPAGPDRDWTGVSVETESPEETQLKITDKLSLFQKENEHWLEVKKKTGETDMHKALQRGDMPAFSRAVQESLKGPARQFLEDWLTVTKEGDTILHLLAKIPGREAARAAYELTQVADFPVKDTARPKALFLRGYRLFEALEKTALYRSTYHTEPNEAFKRELKNLLSGPAMDMLAVLHAVTHSRTSLPGIIKKRVVEGKQLNPFWFDAVNTLLIYFRRPWRMTNKQWQLPLTSAAKAKNREMYYVLRSFAGDGNEKGTDALTALVGVGGIWGLELLTIWKPGNEELLFRLAEQTGVEAGLLLDISFYGPLLLTAGGIACHRLFKSRRQKHVLEHLKRKIP